MNIIDVIPISRGIILEKLSYFTSEAVEPGSVVSVPLRKKTVTAIVLSVRRAEDARAEIRGADFEMKKITGLDAKQFFLPEFIDACAQTAIYFASSTGAVMSALVPKQLFEYVQKTKEKSDTHSAALEKLHEKYAVQEPDEERYANYKAFIREQFARKLSVFFCLPGVQDIETTASRLEKGIEEYTYVLHSALKPKELAERFKKILEEKHPILIIATGAFLSLPRRDIGAIIVDKENSRGYKIQARPHLDIRTFAEFLAKKIQAKFLVGDLFLQTETMHRYRNGDFHELYPLKFRSLTTARDEMVDMRLPAGSDTKKSFDLLSEELKKLIAETKQNSENLFIFTARKGLSPSTVCGDCGTIVTCNNCDNPLVLHGKKINQENQNTKLSKNELSSKSDFSANFFLCHHCGERRDPAEHCKICGGWRLVTLGIGTERVAEEIRREFPDTTVFVFDKEKVTTHKRAVALANEFYNSPGSVMVGTEMAFLYLDRPIANTAVASLDSFFSIPDFKMSEKILAILLKLRALAGRRFLLQTRSPEQKVFEYALRGNIIDFYRDELELRKTFAYPPFSILIKISLEGKRDVIAAEMHRAKELFSENEFDVFPSFIKGEHGRSILHALLKIPAEKWPDEEIVRKLHSLPPHFTIKVDPESLL